jgi:hypothetical protein
MNPLFSNGFWDLFWDQRATSSRWVSEDNAVYFQLSLHLKGVLASKFKFFFAVHIVRIVVCKNETSFDSEIYRMAQKLYLKISWDYLFNKVCQNNLQYDWKMKKYNYFRTTFLKLHFVHKKR